MALFDFTKPEPDFAALAKQILAGEVNDKPDLTGGASQDIPALVDKYAEKYGIPAPWFHGKIQVESGFNPQAKAATSSATGLTQVLKGALTDYNTAHGTNYTSKDLTNPDISLDVGGWYFNKMPGNTPYEKSMAYYAGPNNLKNPKWVKRARAYADKVARASQGFSKRGILKQEPDFASIARELLGQEPDLVSSETVSFPSGAFDNAAPDFAGMAAGLLASGAPDVAQFAAPPAESPGLDPKIQQQIDWAKKDIKTIVGMVPDVKNMSVEVPNVGRMSPQEFERGIADGSIRLSRGELNRVRNEIAGIDLETIKYTAENDVQTAKNYGAVNALSKMTGRPIKADAPPPLEEDPILWGSFQKLLRVLGTPQSMIVGPIASVLESGTTENVLDEGLAALKGERSNSWRRVLDAAFPDQDWGTFDAGALSWSGVQGRQLREAGYSSKSPVSFTGKGAVSLAMDMILDPLNLVGVGIPNKAIALSNGLRLSEKGKKTLQAMMSAIPDGVDDATRAALQQQIRARAEDAIRLAVDAGDQTLVAKGGVRIAGLQMPLTHEAGQLAREVAKKGAQAVRKTGPGRFVADEMNKLISKFERDWLVKPYFEYVKYKQGYFNHIKANRQELLDRAQVVFGTLKKHEREAVTDAVEAGAIDNPTWTTLGERYEASPGVFRYRTQDIVPTDEMRNAARAVTRDQTNWREVENSLGIGGGFLENYMMRRWKNYPSVREAAQAKFGTWLRANQNKPLSDITTLEMMDLVPSLEPATRDAMELYLMRGMSSIRAQSAYHFIAGTLKKYGRDFNQSGDWFQDMERALQEGYIMPPRIVTMEKGYEIATSNPRLGPDGKPVIEPLRGVLPTPDNQRFIAPDTAQNPPAPAGEISSNGLSVNTGPITAQKSQQAPSPQGIKDTVDSIAEPNYPVNGPAYAKGYEPTSAGKLYLGMNESALLRRQKKAVLNQPVVKPEKVAEAKVKAKAGLAAALEGQIDPLVAAGSGRLSAEEIALAQRLGQEKADRFVKDFSDVAKSPTENFQTIDQFRAMRDARMGKVPTDQAGGAGVQLIPFPQDLRNRLAAAHRAGENPTVVRLAAQEASERAISPALNARTPLNKNLSEMTLEDLMAERAAVTGEGYANDFGDPFGPGMDLEDEMVGPSAPVGPNKNVRPERPPPVGMPPGTTPDDLGGPGAFSPNLPNEIDEYKKSLRWMVPKAIGEDMLTVADPAEASSLWRGFDRVTGAIKTGMTIPFPAFHVRNSVGNVANSFLDIGIQALNPRRHMQVIDILRGKTGSLLTETGESYSYEQIRRFFRDEGLEGAFHGRLDLIQTPEGQILGAKAPPFWSSMGKALVGKDTIRNVHPVQRMGQFFGENIETEARMHLFATYLRRGDSVDAAARRVKQVLFDYDNLSTFEKRWMRRAIPFYTWTRKNIPYQMRKVIESPGRAQALMELYAMPGDQAQIEQQLRNLPPYMSHQLGREVGKDRDGNPIFAISLGMPIEDLARIFPTVRSTESRTGEFLRMNFLSMLHPLFRAIIEEAANKDMYLDRPLDELNTLYSIWGKALEQTPKFVQESVGFDKRKNARGEDVYVMDPRKLHLVRSFVLSRLYSTVGKAFDERKDWATRALNVLTGVTMSTVDTETQILPAFRNRSYQRMKASADEKEQQIRQLRFGESPFDGPSISANELIGKPDPLPANKVVKKVPDVAQQLQSGQIKARDMAAVAQDFADSSKEM